METKKWIERNRKKQRITGKQKSAVLFCRQAGLAEWAWEIMARSSMSKSIPLFCFIMQACQAVL